MNFEEPLYQHVLENLFDGAYVVDQDRKILYWNQTAETISGFSKEETVDSHCWDNLLRHINQEGCSLCQHDCPLTFTLKDGKIREDHVILHHKNGHRVPVTVRVIPLRNERGDITQAIEIFSDNSFRVQMQEQLEELQKLAMIDPLTQIANRRYLESIMHSKLSELERNNWKFGVVFIDVDHFKKFNDTYGHDVGDNVLEMVAKTLCANSRTIDTVGRWGGEEFVVILSNMYPEKLLSTCERLRTYIEHSTLEENGNSLHVTVSIGATLVREGDSIESILQRADQLMYTSKKSGRNCVTMD